MVLTVMTSPVSMKRGTMILAPVSRALHGGLAVGDFEGHVGRELAGEAALLGIGEEHHLHALAFLHEVGVLHDVVGKGDLLVGLFVHEVEGLAVIVQILVGTALHGDGVELDAGGKGVFEDTAVFEVAEFGLDKGGLPGFTCWKYTTTQGLPLNMMYIPFLRSAVVAIKV